MRIITTNQQGHTKLVSERSPLPVTIKDSVPFYFSQDVEFFSTEIDPCLFRRAIESFSTPNPPTDWSIDDASSPTLLLPAQRGVTLTPTTNGFSVDYINTQTGNAIYSIPHNDLDTGTIPRDFYLRCKPIMLRSDRYIPSVLHVFSQSNLGGANTTPARNQILAVYIGAAYPISNTNPNIDFSTYRWVVKTIGQANDMMFTQMNLPANHGLGGLSNASAGRSVGSVQYSFAFPTILPFANNPNSPNWFWYTINIGYFNQHTSAVYHPFGCVAVEAEVIPE